MSGILFFIFASCEPLNSSVPLLPLFSVCFHFFLTPEISQRHLYQSCHGCTCRRDLKDIALLLFNFDLFLLCVASFWPLFPMLTHNLPLWFILILLPDLYRSAPLLKWPYCLIILGYNFCLDHLLNKTFMSYNERINTFPLRSIGQWHHDDVIN